MLLENRLHGKNRRARIVKILAKRVPPRWKIPFKKDVLEIKRRECETLKVANTPCAQKYFANPRGRSEWTSNEIFRFSIVCFKRTLLRQISTRRLIEYEKRYLIKYNNVVGIDYDRMSFRHHYIPLLSLSLSRLSNCCYNCHSTIAIVMSLRYREISFNPANNMLRMRSMNFASSRKRARNSDRGPRDALGYRGY